MAEIILGKICEANPKKFFW